MSWRDRARPLLRLAIAFAFAPSPPHLGAPRQVDVRSPLPPSAPASSAAAPEAHGDFYGDALAIDGNRMIVGAPGAGYAEIRERRRGGWRATAKLRPDGNEYLFGETVAISGNVALVGGADLHVFTRGARGWDERATCESWFGGVAIHGRQLLSAEREDDRTLFRVRDLDCNELQSIELPDSDYEGSSALAVDGDRAIVGTPQAVNDHGAAYFLTADRAGHWRLRQSFLGPEWFGISVALRGDLLAIGDRDAGGFADDPDEPGRGAVHLYARHGQGWRETQVLVPSGPVRGSGLQVVLDRKHLAVLAPWDLDFDDVSSVAVYALEHGRAGYLYDLGTDGVVGDVALDGGTLWLGVSNRAEGVDEDGRLVPAPLE
jgi:hypothetical protein